MSTFKVEIEFNSIQHARNFVAKHRWQDHGSETLISIIDQVDEALPRPPKVGDRVDVYRQHENGARSQWFDNVAVVDETSFAWIVRHDDSTDGLGHSIPKDGAWRLEVVR